MIKFWKQLETELKLRGFSKLTIKTYLLHNQKFIDFLKSEGTGAEYQKSLLSKGSDRTPEDVTNRDLKAYIAYLLSDKGLSPASVNLVISALKFNYVEVLKKQIFAGIVHPKPNKKLPVVLTKEEIRNMVDLTKNKKHKLLILLLYSTGLRVSEAVSLRLRDINLKEKTAFIKYGKGKKERFVKLSNIFIKKYTSYIKKRKNSSIYLFNSVKSPISTRQAERIVKKASLRAGLQKKVFCHALRSSFATHLLDNGTDIRVIQELLGHANLATTERYTHVSKKRILEVRSPADNL
ncbi:MAG: tyrosine-type recombinase/integrase [Nanoarchaeota archaeon]